MAVQVTSALRKCLATTLNSSELDAQVEMSRTLHPGRWHLMTC